MKSVPLNVSESTRRRNPHLYPVGTFPPVEVAVPEPKKRLRQNTKPLMNKLESEFLDNLLATTVFKRKDIHAQSITFRLANGLRYTPDFVIVGWSEVRAYEVKGAWVDGDSFPKLKMAASVFPEMKWRLVWKGLDGRWQEQSVIP